MKSKIKQTTTYAFIDASNIIYGTKNEGWKMDFKKLYKYLSERYNCTNIYYFGGVDKKNEKQEKFYKVLERIGYALVLKPVKIYNQPDGSKVRKANCDVDLTFYAMRDQKLYKKAIFLTGDGDFEILFEYLIEKNIALSVIANGKRTAKEIKQLVGGDFTDLKLIRDLVAFKKRK